MHKTMIGVVGCLLAGLVASSALAQTSTARLTPAPQVKGPGSESLPPRVGCTAIPDDAYDGSIGTMACLTVADPNNGEQILDVNVTIELEHTWAGDLVFKVQAPGGTIGTLGSRPGFAEMADDGTGGFGNNADFVQTSPITFDDQGGGPSAETMGMAGTIVCQDDGICNYVSDPGAAAGVGLADFNGLTASGGNWQVCIGDAGGGDLGNICDATIDFTTGFPGDLSIVKTAPIGVVENMGPYSFQLDVANAGPTAHTNVVVTDTLPAGVMFTGSSCGATAVGQNVTWNVGALGNGATASCQINVVNTVAGCPAITNTAMVTGDMGVFDPPGNNSSTFANAPAGGNVVADSSFEAGSPNPSWAEASSNFGSPICDPGLCGTGGGTAGPLTGTFWVWFGGAGGASEIGSVEQTVTIGNGAATLDFGYWLGACDAAAGAGDFVRATIDGTEIWREDATSAECDAAGYSMESIDVSAFADGGSHVLRFESTSGSAGGNSNFHIDDVTLTVSGMPMCTAAADLSVTKTAVAPDPLLIGSSIIYTLTALNGGTSDVTDAVVVDPLPANVTYVSNTCGATFAAPTLTWNVGALANGASASCDVEVSVNAIGPIVNTATISSSTVDPNPANDAGTSNLAGAFLADLSIAIVSDAPNNLGVGQQYTYTVTGSNAGPSDATGVLLSLALPSKISFVSSSCGAAAAGNIVSWSVPTLAAGASTTCDITVAVVAPGDIIVDGNITSATPDPNLVNNDTQIVVGFLVTAVPTLGHLGLLLIALMLAGAGLVAIRRS